MKREIIEISEKIYCLQGTRSSNIYYLDFDKKAIIDSGHPLEIKDNLTVFKNYDLELDKIDYIINTHSHGDHVGANAYLKKINPSIKIIASSKKEQYQIKRKKIELLKGAEDDFDEYKIDIAIDNNETIELGNEKLRVIGTPGHTSDSAAFYLENKKILFSGDIIYPRVITQLDYYQDLIKSLNELMNTYNNLLKLDVDVYYTGHGEPIENPRENINMCLRKLKRFEKQPEMILVNNLIPSIEFYLHKNKNKSAKEVKVYFLDNMMKFKKAPYFAGIEDDKFIGIVDKTIALMKLMKMLNEENGVLYPLNELNEYIGIIKK